MNWSAFGAAVAATILAVAHGGVGHFWHRAQLRGVTFAATTLVGDADAAGRFFAVSWHIVTVFFVATAAVLFAAAFGRVHSPALLHAVAGVYAVVLMVALAHFGRRLRALLAPIPSLAGASMLALVVLAWLAA